MNNVMQERESIRAQCDEPRCESRIARFGAAEGGAGAMRKEPTEIASLAMPIQTIDWPDPTDEMIESNGFGPIWDCIKSWDINVPAAYGGYCGATGNHVRAIMDALYYRGFRIVPIENKS